MKRRMFGSVNGECRWNSVQPTSRTPEERSSRGKKCPSDDRDSQMCVVLHSWTVFISVFTKSEKTVKLKTFSQLTHPMVFIFLPRTPDDVLRIDWRVSGEQANPVHTYAAFLSRFSVWKRIYFSDCGNVSQNRRDFEKRLTGKLKTHYAVILSWRRTWSSADR